MNAAAPAVLIALEQSPIAAAIRQSTWIYPAANTTHVVAIALFAGAVAVLDVRLMGGLTGSDPARVLRGARRAAIAAFLLVAASGLVLFAAEASHVALNPAFQVKLALIAFGLAHALVIGGRAVRHADQLGPTAAMPAAARLAGVLSMTTWLTVVAAGRLIAYR